MGGDTGDTSPISRCNPQKTAKNSVATLPKMGGALVATLATLFFEKRRQFWRRWRHFGDAIGDAIFTLVSTLSSHDRFHPRLPSVQSLHSEPSLPALLAYAGHSISGKDGARTY